MQEKQKHSEMPYQTKSLALSFLKRGPLADEWDLWDHTGALLKLDDQTFIAHCNEIGPKLLGDIWCESRKLLSDAFQSRAVGDQSFLSTWLIERKTTAAAACVLMHFRPYYV